MMRVPAVSELSEKYDVEKEIYLDVARHTADRETFLWATKRYLTVLGDAHTSVAEVEIYYLPLRCRYMADRLYRIYRGEVTKEYLTKIGGVQVEMIEKLVDTYYVAENDAARKDNYEQLIGGRSILKLAGCELKDEQSAEVTYYNEETGMENTEVVSFVEKDYFACYNNSDKIVDSKMLGDVFYIDFDNCMPGKDITAQVSAIRKAMKGGTYKFIIDVRNNPGGDARACEQLLNAMDMETPGYGMLARESKLSGPVADESELVQGCYIHNRDKETGRKNPDIELVVLQNAKTFSSAHMLTTWVQDGKLGIVIGQTSTNSATAYGDHLTYHMPQSGVDTVISYKIFLRPDGDADPTAITPDIVLDEDTDALNYALDYLAQK